MIESNSNLGLVGGAQSVGSTTLSGPKTWEQCSVDEKLERLRQEIDGWRRQCARLRESLSLFEGHQHGADGTILVSMTYASSHSQIEQAGQSYNLLR